jgi:hypothetical protein
MPRSGTSVATITVWGRARSARKIVSTFRSNTSTPMRSVMSLGPTESVTRSALRGTAGG